MIDEFGVTEFRRFFGGSKVATPKPLEPAPKEEDKAVQDVSAAAARDRKLARGYRSTILSQMAGSGGQPGTKETLGS